MTHASFFTGSGGFDYALEVCGFSTVFQCETDRYANAVLEHWWPEVPRIEDINEVDGSELRGIDVFSAGWPCQDISRAGAKRGLSGERSGLFFSFARVVEEARPRAIIWENVPRLLSSNKGGDIRLVIKTMAELGYSGVWRSLRTTGFGLPQPRTRVYGVFFRDDSGGWPCAASVLLDAEDCGGATAQGAKKQEEIASTIEGCSVARISSGMMETPCMYDGRKVTPTLDVSLLSKRQMLPERARCMIVIESDSGVAPDFRFANECELCPCCGEPYCALCDMHYADCNCYGPDNIEELEGVSARVLTPLECERAQGFPDNWTNVGISDTQRYKLMGNAVSVPVVVWIGTRLSLALEEDNEEA